MLQYRCLGTGRSGDQQGGSATVECGLGQKLARLDQGKCTIPCTALGLSSCYAASNKAETVVSEHSLQPNFLLSIPVEAGLILTRSVDEVHQLERALQIIIYRAVDIQTACVEASRTLADLKQVQASIPCYSMFMDTYACI